ncbi:tetrachloroethene reductive dehalogenase PceA [Photobacterium aphoticum]|uniref:Tetrachloroethene reductive dehalogenase PceA n=1 Tax=Photobacterium aphoticum TaxID=754436 RepID=A0A090QL10_9GAMM|nr:tetrachloroethene reductive dehalogenase PceA [Photobacterium aphoticum]
MEVAGELTRPEWGDFLFHRTTALAQAITKGWTPTKDWRDIPHERTREYYSRFPERWADMYESFSESAEHDANVEKNRPRFALSWAYSAAYYRGVTSNFPPKPEGHPDEVDFQWVKDRPRQEFQSPKHASELIKKWHLNLA